MDKVIVERPRRLPLGAAGGAALRPGRPARDPDDLPSRQSLKRAHVPHLSWRGKEFSDNLAPLRRYLLKQVGRPWNKVFGEICAKARLDSVVQRHLRVHVRELVDEPPLGADGKPLLPPFRRLPYLYVDPRNGLLRVLRRRR